LTGFGDEGAPIARAIADSGSALLAWARESTSLDALDGVAFTAPGSLPALLDPSKTVVNAAPAGAGRLGRIAKDGLPERTAVAGV
jgi:hypothetical protein